MGPLTLLRLDVFDVEPTNLVQATVGTVLLWESIKISDVVFEEANVCHLPVEAGVDDIVRYRGSNPQHKLIPFKQKSP